MDENAVISLERKVLVLAWIVKHCFEFVVMISVCLSMILFGVGMPIEIIGFAFGLILSVALAMVLGGVNTLSLFFYLVYSNGYMKR